MKRDVTATKDRSKGSLNLLFFLSFLVMAADSLPI